MTISGVAGYYSMEYWYQSSLRERSEFYSAAYHDHSNDEMKRGVKKHKTVRDGHYEGRKRLFDKSSVRLTPYHQLKQQQQRKKSEEERVVTMVAPHPPVGDLQRQVTKFW